MLWLMCSHWMRTLPHYCLLWNLEVSKAENVMITWSLSFFQTRRSTTTSYIDPVFLVDMQLYSYCTCYRVCALLNFMHRITVTITIYAQNHCHHTITIIAITIITITIISPSLSPSLSSPSSSPSHHHHHIYHNIITLSQHHHHHHIYHHCHHHHTITTSSSPSHYHTLLSPSHTITTSSSPSHYHTLLLTLSLSQLIMGS